MKLGRSQLTTATFPSHIAWRDITNFQVPDFKIRMNVINKRKFAVQTQSDRERNGRTDGRTGPYKCHIQICNTTVYAILDTYRVTTVFVEFVASSSFVGLTDCLKGLLIIRSA
jgi:hypothetical protein